MTTIVLIVLLVLAAFVIGCLSMRGDAASNVTPPMPACPSASGDVPIDPADDHLLGQLVALTGGAVTDAAVARNALERFEAEQGRQATTADLGTLVGMMRAMR